MKPNKKDLGKSGIYCIKNLLDNKSYVGKAKDIYRRVIEHISRLNSKSKDENRHLINAWHKHGKDNFEVFVLEYTILDDIILAEKELYWQDKLDVHNRKYGYNLRRDSQTKCIVSDETREKMRTSRYEALKNPEILAKCSHTFWKDNPEECKKMAKKVADLTRKYKIAKCDYDTIKILEIFDSKEDLKNKNPNYYIQAILGCCSGDKKSYKQFQWRYISIKTGELILNKRDK